MASDAASQGLLFSVVTITVARECMMIHRIGGEDEDGRAAVPSARGLGPASPMGAPIASL